MDCKTFRNLYTKLVPPPPLPRSVMDSDEFIDWHDHLRKCSECSEWYMEKQVRSRGFEVEDFPCVHIAYHSTMECDSHDNPWDCPDMTLVKTVDGFGIPVRDRGGATIYIYYCPWCGISLMKP